MKRFLFCIAIIIVVFGCNSEKKKDATEPVRETSAEALDSLGDAQSAASKIIKTADMRFRVRDVQKTKEQLTATIKAQGGTVAEFNISTNVQETEKLSYAIDSLKEVTPYRREGTIVAKVPSEKLDDFTNSIAKIAVFVDQQAMKMDDQSLIYLANRWKAQNRLEALQSVKSASKKGSNVETSLYIKDDYVDKRIENMDINNRVEFSTITLNFYQDNAVHTVIVANDRISHYGPAFFKRVALNLWTGWSFLKEFILALVTIWPFIALGTAVFFIVRYLINRSKLLNEIAIQNQINGSKL